MNISQNIPLKDFTTVKIGGPAQYFCKVTSAEELTQAFKCAQEKSLPYLVIGGGSNLLISDEGFPGLVIKNEIHGLASQGQALEVQSGTKLQELVNFTVENGFGGLHKLTGIPGTVGGAVFGNAGAYGQTISQNISQVICFDGKNIVTLNKDQCQFSYRDSIFKTNKFIILEVHFQLEKGDPNMLKEESVEIRKQRDVTYPQDLKCPGSFFKNIPLEKISPQSLALIPQDKITFDKVPAGLLLEIVGAKGQQLGKIQISPNHANLFINSGEGTGKDFWDLAQKYAQEVKEKFGVELEPEVQLINLK